MRSKIILAVLVVLITTCAVARITSAPAQHPGHHVRHHGQGWAAKPACSCQGGGQ